MTTLGHTLRLIHPHESAVDVVLEVLRVLVRPLGSRRRERVLDRLAVDLEPAAGGAGGQALDLLLHLFVARDFGVEGGELGLGGALGGDWRGSAGGVGGGVEAVQPA